jgi:hypothetical protein
MIDHSDVILGVAYWQLAQAESLKLAILTHGAEFAVDDPSLLAFSEGVSKLESLEEMK